MHWKQFFTSVESIDAASAKKIIDENSPGAVTILDVRQSREYENEHIPGAMLIPLPELKDRMDEIDQEKPVVVYCAIGGRSRIAAQMLSGKGFSRVYNLSGGIKAWHGNTAHGPVDQGLELFSGRESAEDVLVTGYSLEKGLMNFYQEMGGKVKALPVRDIFNKLAAVEITHQNRLLQEYNRLTGKDFVREAFDREIVTPAVEGGLSTEEYMRLFTPDLDSPSEVVGLAMSIEAQALDLYYRASENAQDPGSRDVLHQIALEEQEHLKMLGKLFAEF